ncbi:U-box domain-containing protein 9 isoform X1 [Prunus yedoensis var. nudiflora]|uniref:U-box domain-containing protein 9 isoform X1 n=1 Tax=Prunus yedoensis var. nudiflora TaxID=2094558 RepID=A0A314YSF6_PRUYE|nr:U-box domain-containing protein 9 isoform X1 [Prunus yedoensis var. nudiflora]
MGKTGVFDSDPAMVAKATELKEELQRLVRAIVDDEDFSTQTIDQAKDTLDSQGIEVQEEIAVIEAE